MALDINDLFSKMVTAAKDSLAAQWPAISTLASSSIKTLAHNFVEVEKMLATGAISKDQAALMIDMQKNSLKIVLLSEEGLGLIAAQSAINAVIGVVRDTVNGAIGFALI